MPTDGDRIRKIIPDPPMYLTWVKPVIFHTWFSDSLHVELHKLFSENIKTSHLPQPLWLQSPSIYTSKQTYFHFQVSHHQTKSLSLSALSPLPRFNRFKKPYQIRHREIGNRSIRMGVLRSTQSLQAEVEEMREMLRGSAVGSNSRKGLKMQPASVKRLTGGEAPEGDERIVCVTGGISFVGFAVVNRLLEVGYTVRLALETQGQFRNFDLL